ncbi:MAG: hypothetical protein J5814_03635 [Bacteroidaceae bacterium]|nr:hypothetical protein [Bacteroidaceae bacterium]
MQHADCPSVSDGLANDIRAERKHGKRGLFNAENIPPQADSNQAAGRWIIVATRGCTAT